MSLTGGLPLYLTGVSNRRTWEAAHATGVLGVLTRPGNNYWRHAHRYPSWAADNGQYTLKGQTWSDDDWWAWLREAVPVAGRDACHFATAPDVLTVEDGPSGPIVVGDARATLERSLPWLPRIRALGVPAALVAQDGVEELDLPWDEFDVLFLGGSTEWKLSPQAKSLTARALVRGLGVHMGRVNSGRRLRIAASWGADSVDGTFLAFHPTLNLKRLLAWYGLEHEGEPT